MKHILSGLIAAVLLASCTRGAETGASAQPIEQEAERPITSIDALPPANPVSHAQEDAAEEIVAQLEIVTQTPFQPRQPTQPPTLIPTSTATLLPAPTPTSTPFVWGGPVIPQKAYPGAPQPLPVLTSEDTLDLLLIGSDARGDGSFRTDTLIVVIIWPEQQAVSMISIPRDLYVYIPTWQENRINTAYMHGKTSKYPGGGPGLLKATILYNLGIRIDRVAMVDFNGFRKMIDAIGGVDIPLACAFTDWHIVNSKRSSENPDNWKLYSIGPGLVHMDGELALWYARSRLRSNDFDRGRRQQEIMRAVYSKGLQLDLLSQIPELYEQLKDSFTTDLNLADLLSLVPLAAKLDEASLRSYYISSKMVTGWISPTGASVLLPKRGKLLEMLKEALSPPDGDEVIRRAAQIEIYNATGHPEWDQLAAERLHYAGFETHLVSANDLGMDPTGVLSQSVLYDMTASQDARLAARVLAAMGLPVSRLNPAPGSSTTATFRLMLGKDYRPCFNPAKLSH